jgi:hypothetical protein
VASGPAQQAAIHWAQIIAPLFSAVGQEQLCVRCKTPAISDRGCDSFAGSAKTDFLTTPIDANFQNEIDSQNQWPILNIAVSAAKSSPDYS